MDEVWKDIPGYEGHYQVSNMGNIRSFKRGVNLLKPRGSRNGGGYSHLSLYMNGNEKDYNIHRLVAAAFVPNPNAFSEVNHIDENKHNNKASNLEWCSRLYNMNYGDIKRKMSVRAKAQFAEQEARDSISKRMKDMRWINNGIIGKRVHSGELQIFIDSGWKRGRPPHKHKMKREET